MGHVTQPQLILLPCWEMTPGLAQSLFLSLPALPLPRIWLSTPSPILASPYPAPSLNCLTRKPRASSLSS